MESVEKKWGEKVWSNELGLKIIDCPLSMRRKLGKTSYNPRFPAESILHITSSFRKRCMIRKHQKKKTCCRSWKDSHKNPKSPHFQWVVHVALNQAAKPWKPMFRSVGTIWALFPKKSRGQICNLAFCWVVSSNQSLTGWWF